MDYRVKDMKNKKYGKLLGLNYSHTEKSGAYWLFKCDCGNEKVINASVVRQGKVVSCGCYAKEVQNKRITTHGMARTRTYDIWVGIKQRCLNPKSLSYEIYGGRGISLCEEWQTFEKFFEDMGEAPEDYSIERIDNNRGYSKENCKWANRSMQNLNKRYQNKTTGIRNISHNQRDNSFSVGFSRNKKRYRKDFKILEEAIQWKKEMLEKLDD